jgi:excisionase family DNA binding protein
MNTPWDNVITASIGEFCRLSGIGRTKVYELLGDGNLESISIGRRRLIVLDSYRRLIQRQRPGIGREQAIAHETDRNRGSRPRRSRPATSRRTTAISGRKRSPDCADESESSPGPPACLERATTRHSL